MASTRRWRSMYGFTRRIHDLIPRYARHPYFAHACPHSPFSLTLPATAPGRLPRNDPIPLGRLCQISFASDARQYAHADSTTSKMCDFVSFAFFLLYTAPIFLIEISHSFSYLPLLFILSRHGRIHGLPRIRRPLRLLQALHRRLNRCDCAFLTFSSAYLTISSSHLIS
jgi:hypothetical protein